MAADELFEGLYKYKLSRKYNVTKHLNDLKLNEGRDYSFDLLKNSMSKHLQRNETMINFIEFMQDILVEMVKAVTALKLFKAYTVPKDYKRVK